MKWIKNKKIVPLLWNKTRVCIYKVGYISETERDVITRCGEARRLEPSSAWIIGLFLLMHPVINLEAIYIVLKRPKLNEKHNKLVLFENGIT